MTYKIAYGSVYAALLGSAALCAVLQAEPAMAQADQPPAAQPRGEIEEIVVTARKRQESILKVPVDEMALGQKQLSQFATADLKGVTAQVPDLLVGTALAAMGNQVSLRGIGTSTLDPTIDQSVALNLDGLELTQGLAYQSGMFDVGQVEVLKGPQALFYGKSSTGGVIVLNSANPTDTWEIIGQAGYEAEASEKNGELIISGPVTDTLEVRLAVSASTMDGFFKNVAVVPAADSIYGGLTPRFRNFAPETDYLIRETTVWAPSSRFDVQFKGNYTNTFVNGDGGAMEYKSCPSGTADPLGIPFLSPAETCKIGEDIRVVDMNPKAFLGIRNGGTPFTNMWQAFGTVKANYRIQDDLTLTSVTGYYSLYQQNLINGANSEIGTTIAADDTFSKDDFTEELRLASDFTGPVNFTAGTYLESGHTRDYINLLGNTFLYGGGVVPPVIFRGTDHTLIRTYSGFGQVTWDILPQVQLAAGARWTAEQREMNQENAFSVQPAFGSPNKPLGYTPLAVPKISSSKLNPETTLTYTPTDDLMLYVAYKQASKSGSFNTVQIWAPGTDASFRDEAAEGFEGGLKSRLLDRTLSLDLNAYDYNYSNLQVGASVLSPSGTIDVVTQNAASARVYGVDLDSAYEVPAVEGLQLHGSLNWNHARYGIFDNAVCWGGQTIAQGCDREFDAATGLYAAQSLSGRPLVRAPEWSTTFGFDYETEVGNNMALSFASSTLFTSRYYTDLIDRSDTLQNAYFKTNFSVTLLGPNDGWELALIGNNLNNALTTSQCSNSPSKTGVVLGGGTSGGTSSGLGSDSIECNVDRGRELWVRLTVKPLEFLQ